MERVQVRELFAAPNDFGGKTVTVAGWCRTIRDSKAFGFIELNDGSYFKSVQVVFEASKVENYKQIASVLPSR